MSEIGLKWEGQVLGFPGFGRKVNQASFQIWGMIGVVVTTIVANDHKCIQQPLRATLSKLRLAGTVVQRTCWDVMQQWPSPVQPKRMALPAPSQSSTAGLQVLAMLSGQIVQSMHGPCTD